MQSAIRSLAAACDRVLVFEGPAGEPLTDDRIPESVLAPAVSPSEWDDRFDLVRVTYGSWRTDAEKRSAMVAAQRPFAEPTWGVWIDGDEVLVNAEYLRDWLRFFDWQEEETGVQNMGWPVKLVEMDGSIAVCQAKVLRIDRLDSYSVSSSVFRNVMGELEGGVTATLRLSGASSPGTGVRMEINGDAGDLVIIAAPGGRGIQMSDLTLYRTIAMGQLEEVAILPSAYTVPEDLRACPPLNVGESYLRMADAIAGRRKADPDFGDAVVLHKLLDCIELSAREGRRRDV